VKIIGSLLAMSLATSPVPAKIGPPLNPETIHNRVAATGAVSVVRGLSDKQFEWILDRVEHGDAQWIRVLVELKRGADGWRGEAVDISLSRALQTNPSEVLRMLRQGYGSVKSICGDNDIEPSKRSVSAFNSKALKALAAVQDPSLQKLRLACAANIPEN
jgi:hypothetical protein